MKHTSVGLAFGIWTALTGCVYTANYQFDNIEPPENIHVADSRPDADRIAVNPCRNGGVSNIADKNIHPSKIELFKTRFAKQVKSESNLEVVLQQFNLRLVEPGSCKRTRDAAIAGALMGAFGGAVYSASDKRSEENEGVLCELRYQLNGWSYTGRSLVEAQDGVDSLNGIAVSTKKLIDPIVSAVDRCIADSLNALGSPL